MKKMKSVTNKNGHDLLPCRIGSNIIFSFVLSLQTEKSPYRYRGIFHALSTVLREEGPRALYRGWFPSVIGVVSTIFPKFLLCILAV